LGSSEVSKKKPELQTGETRYLTLPLQPGGTQQEEAGVADRRDGGRNARRRGRTGSSWDYYLRAALRARAGPPTTACVAASQQADAAGGRAQQEALSVGWAEHGEASPLVFELKDEKKAAIGQLPSQLLQRL
jgi:hypothetical protein